MGALSFELAVQPAPTQFLLTVRGSLSAPDLDGGRKAHNQVAGSDPAVAMARSFGDLSHAVFVPLEPVAKGAGELLIIDYWNSVEGLQSFFAAEQVQAGGPLLFASDRENVIWHATPGLPRFSLQAPTGRHDRFVGLARVMVSSRQRAETALTEALRRQVNAARARGLMSREWYFRLSPPGAAPSLEAIGVDIWFDEDGMLETYQEAAEEVALAQVFAAPPVTSVWKKPPGSWVEW